MINIYRFFALIVGLLMVQSSFSQKYFVKSYTIKNGLSTRIVNDVCQDSLGNMWFATYNGISVYDGFSFKNYDVRDGLSKYHYRKVKYMGGMIWGIPYGLADSIACLRNREWQKITPASTVPNVEVSSFDLNVINGKTVICLGSSIGLEIYQDNRWNHVNISTDPAQNEIISITSAHDRFYVLTKAGVFMVARDKNGWHAGQIVKPIGEPMYAIKMEQKTSSGEKLWMLSSSRLTYLQNGKFIDYMNGLSVPDPVQPGLSYITFDTSGNIFIGNNLAKYFIDKRNRKVSPLSVRNGLSAEGATSICVDKEQNVWFTDTRGIDKISCLLLINYFENTGLLENEVTGIVELSDGRLVFGHNGGLTIMDHGKLKQIPFLQSGNIQSRVMDIMQDSKGDVWFTACALGVGKLKKDGTLQWYHVTPPHIAVAIHQDLSGRIWVGTNHALFYFENEKLISHEANRKKVSPFRKIYSNNKGEIIGAGLYGFYTISDTEFKMFPTDEVKINSFFSYVKSSTGAEYLGSGDGLCMIENGRIRKVKINGSTIDNPVYIVFQDRNQYFWIGSKEL